MSYQEALVAFVEKFASEHPTEAEAVRDASLGFADLWKSVARYEQNLHDVLTDFVFGVDDRLPPHGDVRGNMFAAIQASHEYDQVRKSGQILSYEQAKENKIPDLTVQEYDAMRNGEYLLKKPEGRWVVKSLSEIRKLVGEDKQFSVWSSSDLIRHPRLLVVRRYDIDFPESPTLQTKVTLQHKEWAVEKKIEFVVDTGATHSIINIRKTDYDEIPTQPTSIEGIAGNILVKEVTAQFSLGGDSYYGTVRVSPDSKYNLLGMDFIKNACLVMVQGHLSLTQNVAV